MQKSPPASVNTEQTWSVEQTLLVNNNVTHRVSSKNGASLAHGRKKTGPLHPLSPTPLPQAASRVASKNCSVLQRRQEQRLRRRRQPSAQRVRPWCAALGPVLGRDLRDWQQSG